MKRQRIRKALIIVSFMLFPITLNYFSPAIIIQGAASGIAVGSFITFAILFISSLLFGRLFCGWVCPGAGIQETLFLVENKRAKGGWRNWIKYIIWVPWLSLIVVLFIKSGGVHSVKPLYLQEHGVSLTDINNYIIYYSVLALIVLPAFIVGRRGFCHSFCWMAPFMIIGLNIANLTGWPVLCLTCDNSKCTDCKTCTKNCPMSLDVNQMVQQGWIKSTDCILCGTCVDGCAKKVIVYSFKAGNKP